MGDGHSPQNSGAPQRLPFSTSSSSSKILSRARVALRSGKGMSGGGGL